jgi:uncharacterized protein (DUF1778 family)
MSASKRTALLIRCSVEEAERIRSAAKKEGRTLSGYVLHCLHRRLELEGEMEMKLARFRHPYKQ